MAPRKGRFCKAHPDRHPISGRSLLCADPAQVFEVRGKRCSTLDRVISTRQGVPKEMTETAPDSHCLGYARVSTAGQTLDIQLEQLRVEGCTPIFGEQVSGARTDRRELLCMLKSLSHGDLVTISRLAV